RKNHFKSALRGGIITASSNVYSPSPLLLEAASDLRYLLNRGYNREGALRLIVDRYLLSKEDRMVLYRNIYRTDVVNQRMKKIVKPSDIRDQIIRIDGYNVLITIETGIMGDFIVQGDDGFLRDIAGRHRSYTGGEVTSNALEMIINGIDKLKPSKVTILFDRPISHSGKLSSLCTRLFRERNILGVSETSHHVDRDLLSEQGIICSSDSVILDSARSIFDFAKFILKGIKSSIFVINQ
ncbi:MAG: DUF434 domain-containing protein, partial [Candidatus Ranarchaeia archaeon]